MARVGVKTLLRHKVTIQHEFDESYVHGQKYFWYCDDDEGMLTYNNHNWWYDFKDKVMRYSNSTDSYYDYDFYTIEYMVG